MKALWGQRRCTVSVTGSCLAEQQPCTGNQCRMGCHNSDNLRNMSLGGKAGENMTKADHSCQMCGKCCSFELPVTLLDMHSMAKHLGMPEKRVFKDYVQDTISSRSSLFMLGKKAEGTCLFFTEDHRCAIHRTKPRACEFFACTLSSEKDALPWTATYTAPSQRAKLWEQSVAVMMTQAYVKKNGTTWVADDFNKAITGICDNILLMDSQKLKVARNTDGTPLAMLYDCTQCETRGTCAKETPVTLDDIRRISSHLNLTRKEFFAEKIAPEGSDHTGGLKLNRQGHCVFFDPVEHCTIAEVRPMHCRFTPCPKRTETAEMMDCLFLGSGTVEDQFRHQVAMAMTRQYVDRCDVGYSEYVFEEFLKRMDHLLSDRAGFKGFCEELAPYRYVDDTLIASKEQDNMVGENADF